MPAKTKPANKSTSSTKHIQELVPTVNPLMELFINNLRAIYWAENHLVKALAKMKSESSSKHLQKAIADHLKVTRVHVSRLEKVFEIAGQMPLARKCNALEGLSLDGEGTIEDTIAGTPVRDLGINHSCQKVEQFEIAAYKGLIDLATTLDLNDAADILHQTLLEEQESLDLLNEQSKSYLNGI